MVVFLLWGNAYGFVTCTCTLLYLQYMCVVSNVCVCVCALLINSYFICYAEPVDTTDSGSPGPDFPDGFEGVGGSTDSIEKDFNFLLDRVSQLLSFLEQLKS